MKKPPLLVMCGACKGTGKRELRAELQQTLDRLRKCKKPQSTADLMESDVTQSAIKMRLRELHEHGYVEKAGKRGKAPLWKAI